MRGSDGEAPPSTSANTIQNVLSLPSFQFSTPSLAQSEHVRWFHHFMKRKRTTGSFPPHSFAVILDDTVFGENFSFETSRLVSTYREKGSLYTVAELLEVGSAEDVAIVELVDFDRTTDAADLVGNTS